jgi:hypothetical protein
MNLAPQHVKIVNHIFTLWLNIRRIFPRRKCLAFGVKMEIDKPIIEKIYVIN